VDFRASWLLRMIVPNFKVGPSHKALPLHHVTLVPLNLLFKPLGIPSHSSVKVNTELVTSVLKIGRRIPKKNISSDYQEPLPNRGGPDSF